MRNVIVLGIHLLLGRPFGESAKFLKLRLGDSVIISQYTDQSNSRYLTKIAESMDSQTTSLGRCKLLNYPNLYKEFIMVCLT